MSVVVLRFQPESPLILAVRSSGDALIVQAASTAPIGGEADARARGIRIASAINAWGGHGRRSAVVVIPRSALHWQNMELPPSPAEDLADLVHLQAQRDLPLADDGLGFDFLPFEGDETHSYRVLGVGVTPGQLEEIRQTCEAAHLKLERIVPEPFGWPEIGRYASAAAGLAAGAFAVFAAVTGRQAIIWAGDGQQIAILRTIWLTPEGDQEADLVVLGNELRRTLMAVVQSSPAKVNGAPLPCVFCGSDAQDIASRLGMLLTRHVDAVELASIIQFPAAEANVRIEDVAPLAALGAALASGRPPAVDLLHPRRRPAPPSRTRTYVLAGAAAALAALTVAWTGYRNVTTPLDAAEAADARRLAMTDELESLAVDEEKAAAVESWLAESVNLLSELDELSRRLRPEPLDSEKFNVREDLVVTKLTVAQRQFAVEGAAHTNDALQPVEQRLRGAYYRVDRGAVSAASKAVPGYEVSVSAVIEPVEGDSAESEAAP